MEVNKMNEKEFLKAMRSIKTIPDICRDLKIDYSNVYNEKTSKENLKKVCNELRLEILKANSFLKEYDAYGD